MTIILYQNSLKQESATVPPVVNLSVCKPSTGTASVRTVTNLPVPTAPPEPGILNLAIVWTGFRRSLM